MKRFMHISVIILSLTLILGCPPDVMEPVQNVVDPISSAIGEILKPIGEIANTIAKFLGLAPSTTDSSLGDVTALKANGNSTQVILSWVNPTDSGFDKVEISYGFGNTDTSFVGTPTNTGTVIKGLTKGKLYTFKVVSVYDSGSKSSGVTVKGATKVANVTGLTIKGGDGKVTLTWTNPNYPELKEILISYPGHEDKVPKPGQTLVITGLVNYKAYLFTVKAIDNGGNESKGLSVRGKPTMIGSVGPGGGVVFYDDEEDGVDDIPNYRFMEVSDRHWNAPWGASTVLTTTQEIGTGLQNTDTIKAVSTATSAANICASATLGGKNDWFLPSKDTLSLILRLAFNGDITIAMETWWQYWSSSADSTGNSAWSVSHSNTSLKLKDRSLSVRAVRMY